MYDRFDFLRPPRMKTSAPTDRALVFLDSRDLINCLEKGKPVDSQELGRILRDRRARLILAMTTLTESFPGSGVPTRADVEAGLALARRLDHLPHTFIRHATIPARELRAAYRAWERNETEKVEGVIPFVDRFYKTLWKPASGTTDLLLDTDETQALDRMTICDQLRVLAIHPESFRWNDSYTVRAQTALDEDRAKYGSKRGTRAAFENAIQRYLQAGGMSEPTGGITAFARWLRNDPQICPGWRLGWDTWEEYRSNVTAPLQPGDLRDFSHIGMTPYVTHATADGKWRDLLSRARKRREKDGLPAPYFDRVYSDLAALLTAL